MTVIHKQTFTFFRPQPGAQPMTQDGQIFGVPLDGSAQVTVPFLQPFAQVCTSVSVQYNPATETDYQISTEVVGTPSVNSFVLVATGGPVGSTGNFTFRATGT